jgi:hypothetical protein
MSTGQADRASVLTSACLRASGASPRHSAIQCARSAEFRGFTGRAHQFPSLWFGPGSRNFVSSESRRPSHVRKATLISVALVHRDLQCESLPARAAIGGGS